VLFECSCSEKKQQEQETKRWLQQQHQQQWLTQHVGYLVVLVMYSAGAPLTNLARCPYHHKLFFILTFFTFCCRNCCALGTPQQLAGE
jgi:hypothetical protein